MRVLLLADVHANWEALLSLQRAEPRPDAVLFAGDAVGYGPDPLPCARWLLANATVAVRGNHDLALDAVADGVAGALPELAEAAHESAAHARQLLAPAERAALAGWPENATVALGGVRFYVAHGTGLNLATCPAAE